MTLAWAALTFPRFQRYLVRRSRAHDECGCSEWAHRILILAIAFALLEKS